jgi:hypothetical protein
VPDSARARSTVRGVIRIQVLANGLGAAVVVLYFQYLYPRSATDELSNISLNVAAFGLYLAVTVLLLLPLNALLLRRAVAWVRVGNPPTDRQRRFLFSLPGFETLTALATWIAAIGLTDAAVIATGDAILVIARSKLPHLKKYLERMKKDGTLPKLLF